MRKASLVLIALLTLLPQQSAEAKKRGKKKKTAAAAAGAPAADPSREPLDRAVLLIKQEEYSDAAVTLEQIAASGGPLADERNAKSRNNTRQRLTTGAIDVG